MKTRNFPLSRKVSHLLFYLLFYVRNKADGLLMTVSQYGALPS